MKTLKFIILLILVMSFKIYSQSRTGIIGNLDFTKAIISANALKVNTKNTIGGSFGLFKEYELQNNIFIRPNFLLSYKSIDFNVNFQTDSPILSYIRFEIPIPILYKVDVNYDKVFFGLGPYFILNGLGKYSDGNNLTVGSGYEDIRPLEAGIQFLGGYEITDKNTFFNITYNTGLTSIVNTNGSFATKLSTFGFTIGHFFNR
jgi:hypothetical protein